ncbi:T-cell surface protein tactile-like [Seriola lalandi dorsalis]|uniref:T-cell surface protein tactile-like n=1 Tax=Seriola lalandi dorsalis TaxID=1841481 RepID=UPI000C6F6E84|nr:T-cell surface protein tactile-like [Seriola lalandi dorsalis]
MSLGSSNMAGTALGAAFSLLLYASVIQGLPDVERTRYEVTEAVVGQNITLPCTVKSDPQLKIVNVEWSKKNTKLALYSQLYGVHLFWPNVTIQIENDTANKLMGSYLHLPAVNEWDSGIYICDIAAFPSGSIRRETELKIKVVVKVTCDVDGAVDVRNGENVTIRCRASADAQYRWTKNKMPVSESESLELWRVTDAHAGVYALTVNTGNQSLHKEFTVTVLTATTSLSTDLSTASPQPVTEGGLIEPAESSFTTYPTTGLSTTDTDVTWSTSTGTDATDDNPRPGNVTITAGENITSFINDTHVSVTSSPATPTHTEPFRFLNATTLRYGSTVFASTQEMAIDEVTKESNGTEESSTTGNITENYDVTPRLSTGTGANSQDTKRSHLAALIVVPILLLIAVVGFLYRRHLIKQRMALPPPFKPPPPPVKYTAAGHREISTQPFPTARCNSVIELERYEKKIY